MSPQKAFGAGRFRALPPAPDRDAFLDFWAGLMRRHCGADPVRISRLFCVTEQTGRNWLAGTSCPLGLHVDHAMALWPAAFAARHGQAVAA